MHKWHGAETTYTFNLEHWMPNTERMQLSSVNWFNENYENYFLLIGNSIRFSLFLSLSPLVRLLSRTQFEPIYSSPKSRNYLQHIILYECQGTSVRLREMERETSVPCAQRSYVPCNAIVAAWFKGTQVKYHLIISAERSDKKHIASNWYTWRVKINCGRFS